MSTTIEQPRASWQGVEMSAQEFLALPDDGIHRELRNIRYGFVVSRGGNGGVGDRSRLMYDHGLSAHG